MEKILKSQKIGRNGKKFFRQWRKIIKKLKKSIFRSVSENEIEKLRFLKKIGKNLVFFQKNAKNFLNFFGFLPKIKKIEKFEV